MNGVLAAYPEAQMAMLSISSSQAAAAAAAGGTQGAGGSQGGTQGAAGAGGGGGATRRPNRGAANRTARLIGMQVRKAGAGVWGRE